MHSVVVLSVELQYIGYTIHKNSTYHNWRVFGHRGNPSVNRWNSEVNRESDSVSEVNCDSVSEVYCDSASEVNCDSVSEENCVSVSEVNCDSDSEVNCNSVSEVTR